MNRRTYGTIKPTEGVLTRIAIIAFVLGGMGIIAISAPNTLKGGEFQATQSNRGEVLCTLSTITCENYAKTNKGTKNETNAGQYMDGDNNSTMRILHDQIITAYTNSVSETDDSPNITGSGLDLRLVDSDACIVANNYYDFGTIVVIGDRVCNVQDRLNRRYDKTHFDMLMLPPKTKQDAREWGVKKLSVMIYEN